MMRDSKIPADYIARIVAANPLTKMPDGTSYRTMPLRLAFCHIVKPNPNAKNDDGTPKATPSYEVTALLPPGAQAQLDAVLWPDIYALLRQEFPSNFQADGRPFGLHCPPWRDQGEKQQYTGYTPGLPFFRCTSQFKPQIVDPAMNPIIDVDGNRVYPGVWAILSINLFVFGKSPPRPKKGVSIGLQSVMIIADDEKLIGGAPPPEQAFAGVQVESRFDPAGQFGAPPAPGAAPPPPGAFMPPPAPVAPPLAVPSAAPPSNLSGYPSVPQTGWAGGPAPTASPSNPPPNAASLLG